MSSNFATESTKTPVVLVVDDSVVDQHRAAGLLRKHGNFEFEFANDGVAALECIAHKTPDLVLTDLQMPELDGLGVVEKVCASYPLIPVVIMTAHGSEVIATEALQKGAASYVPKTELAYLLPQTVESVLSLAISKRQQYRVGDFWQQTAFQFRLENDRSMITPLVNHLQDYLRAVRPSNQTVIMRLGVALHEALHNAIDHGNLELDSSLREQDWGIYYQQAEERRQQEPYKDRLVTIKVAATPEETCFFIRDEGNGFDTSRLDNYDPSDPENLVRCSGRGLYLIKMFMSEVKFNDKGNEITMIHRSNRSEALAT